MSAPNIINATTINGKTAVVSPANTSANAILSNNVANHLLRVVSIYVSNLDTVACNVTVNYHASADNSATARPLCDTLSIPANSTLTLLDRGPLYLEENTSLYVTAGTASKLTVICSYEDIS